MFGLRRFVTHLRQILAESPYFRHFRLSKYQSDTTIYDPDAARRCMASQDIVLGGFLLFKRWKRVGNNT